MTKKEIANKPEFKAAHISYQNGLSRCYNLQEMAHYMFLQGMLFERTKEMPKLEDFVNTEE